MSTAKAPALPSGRICVKLHRVQLQALTEDTIFAHNSSRFYQTRFMSCSLKIRATALALTLTLIFRKCKITIFISNSSF